MVELPSLKRALEAAEKDLTWFRRVFKEYAKELTEPPTKEDKSHD